VKNVRIDRRTRLSASSRKEMLPRAPTRASASASSSSSNASSSPSSSSSSSSSFRKKCLLPSPRPPRLLAARGPSEPSRRPVQTPRPKRSPSAMAMFPELWTRLTFFAPRQSSSKPKPSSSDVAGSDVIG
jgi:hypothetical protein